MGYKKAEKTIGFAEISPLNSLENNRSVKMMERIHKAVPWETIEALVQEHYPIGKSHEGVDAYPPLLLLKCLLLRKCLRPGEKNSRNVFHIPSDPELENQIDDRIFFKTFLGLPFGKPSPDHSTRSRFRSRVSKEAMIQITNEILLQFARKGLSINEGIAIDARLVKSASRPMSTDDRRKLKEKRTTPKGTVDKHGKPFKFARDLESYWTITNDTPHDGLKEHTSVDGQSGFVLATTVTPASASGPDGPPARREHDSKYLPYLTIASCHTTDPIETVYGDKGYYGHPTRAFLHMNGIKDGIMRKDTTTAKLTEVERERNKTRAKKRYIRFRPVCLQARGLSSTLA